jgi:hypothetical protein
LFHLISLSWIVIIQTIRRETRKGRKRISIAGHASANTLLASIQRKVTKDTRRENRRLRKRVSKDVTHHAIKLAQLVIRRGYVTLAVKCTSHSVLSPRRMTSPNALDAASNTDHRSARGRTRRTLRTASRPKFEELKAWNPRSRKQ